jgi:hypothetical protein
MRRRDQREDATTRSARGCDDGASNDGASERESDDEKKISELFIFSSSILKTLRYLRNLNSFERRGYE